MRKNFALAVLVLVVTFLLGAQIPTQVGAQSVLVESPHPYPNNYDHTWIIAEPGAAQLRIHFSTIETDPYGDPIDLYDENDNWVGQYFGTVNDVWSRWVSGDTMKVRLKSDGSYNYFGFIIDDVETRDYIETTPIASFVYNPVSPLFVDEPIYFCAAGLSYDPDGNDIRGNITSYEWDFGDATSGTGSCVVHSYPSIASYTVNLTVTDDDGETASTSKIVNIVAVSRNIALNPTRAGKEDGAGAGYPHPLESDNGWGGGTDKWDIVDGLLVYSVWYNGLAFTGGKRPYIEPCGWRQATINFGEKKTFDRVRVWHDTVGHTPRMYKIQYWNDSDWVDVFSTENNTQGRNMSLSMGDGWPILTEASFSPVTASKVRFVENNCDLSHGWLFEFEVYEPPELIPVTIDIKPGSYPNSINLKSKGVIPVAILTTADFDAASVDPETVLFEGAAAKRWALKDVDEDGDIDLILHFKCQEVTIESDATEACLEGSTYDGQQIEGCDSVRIVPPDADADGDSLGMGLPRIFGDDIEASLRTDQQDACPDDPNDNAWPPDFNNDKVVNILDVILFRGRIMSALGDPGYAERFDLSFDGKIDIVDVITIKPFIMRTCE